MIYFWLILILIFAFLTALLVAPLKINAEYRNGKMKLVFRCLFIRIEVNDSLLKKRTARKKSEVPTTATDDPEKPDGIFDRIRSFRDGYEGVKGIFCEILTLLKDRAEFSGIYIRVRYGTGDAAITGMLYGAIWAFVGNIYSLLCRFLRVEFPTLELEPVFGSKAFEIEAEGIITTRLVHIIIAAFRSIKVYLKHKSEKGAE